MRQGERDGNGLISLVFQSDKRANRASVGRSLPQQTFDVLGAHVTQDDNRMLAGIRLQQLAKVGTTRTQDDLVFWEGEETEINTQRWGRMDGIIE